MSYVLSYTWEWVSIGKLLVRAYLSEHNVLIKSWSGMVDSIYKFSDYSSVQHAPCCRLHHRQTEGKTRKGNNNKKKMIRRGGLQWGIHLVKLGQGARNVWVKTTAFFWGGGVYCWCCFCCVVSVLFGPTVSVFVHCTIPESIEACFLVVLGGGGGGVLLGSGGGICCRQTKQ